MRRDKKIEPILVKIGDVVAGFWGIGLIDSDTGNVWVSKVTHRTVTDDRRVTLSFEGTKCTVQRDYNELIPLYPCDPRAFKNVVDEAKLANDGTDRET